MYIFPPPAAGETIHNQIGIINFKFSKYSGSCLWSVNDIDAAFQDDKGLIGIHTNDNTATVWLKAEDLISIIRDHGNEVNVVTI